MPHGCYSRCCHFEQRWRKQPFPTYCGEHGLKPVTALFAFLVTGEVETLCFLSMRNLLWVACPDLLLVFPLEILCTDGTSVHEKYSSLSLTCLRTQYSLRFYINMPFSLFPEFNVLLKIFPRFPSPHGFYRSSFIFHSLGIYFLVCMVRGKHLTLFCRFSYHFCTTYWIMVPLLTEVEVQHMRPFLYESWFGHELV